jgi:hypothetical protein
MATYKAVEKKYLTDMSLQRVQTQTRMSGAPVNVKPLDSEFGDP